MEKFDDIYNRALERKGSEKRLKALLSEPLDSAQLEMLSDSKWLEALTCKVFQSGFHWQVIEQKWPGFVEVFWGFDVEKLVHASPEHFEKIATDTRIVRNYKKVATVPVNASMIYYCQESFGKPFYKMLAHWPEDNIVQLWLWLKKHGARLGGNTGPYALRAMGKDTFLFSKDVESYLRAHKIIDGGLYSVRSLNAAQSFFNELKAQSGFSLQSLSQLIALSVGDNVRGVGDNVRGLSD